MAIPNEPAVEDKPTRPDPDKYNDTVLVVLDALNALTAEQRRNEAIYAKLDARKVERFMAGETRDGNVILERMVPRLFPGKQLAVDHSLETAAQIVTDPRGWIRSLFPVSGPKVFGYVSPAVFDGEERPGAIVDVTTRPDGIHLSRFMYLWYDTPDEEIDDFVGASTQPIFYADTVQVREAFSQLDPRVLRANPLMKRFKPVSAGVADREMATVFAGRKVKLGDVARGVLRATRVAAWGAMGVPDTDNDKPVLSWV